MYIFNRLFCRTKVSKTFIKSSITHFPFYGWRLCLSPRFWRFFPILFFLKSSIVSCFTLKYIIHFEFISVWAVRRCEVHFLHFCQKSHGRTYKSQFLLLRWYLCLSLPRYAVVLIMRIYDKSWSWVYGFSYLIIF